MLKRKFGSIKAPKEIQQYVSKDVTSKIRAEISAFGKYKSLKRKAKSFLIYCEMMML